jgi:Flp pilus assembly pilin Flp
MKSKKENLSSKNASKFGLRQLARDERGMSTVEYVILLAVIVVGAVAMWNEIGGDVISNLEEARDKVDTLPYSE